MCMPGSLSQQVFPGPSEKEQEETKRQSKRIAAIRPVYKNEGKCGGRKGMERIFRKRKVEGW